MLKDSSTYLYFSNYDDRPGKLFEMIEHLRASIIISVRGKSDTSKIYSTKYNRWYSDHRNLLFENIRYDDVTNFCVSYTIPKFSYKIENEINEKLHSTHNVIANTYNKYSSNKVYYRSAGGGYFLLVKNKKSITYINGNIEDVKAEKALPIDGHYGNDAVGGQYLPLFSIGIT